ncbi:MAG: PEGA domain-containing protein [Verrucomicrobia bacterium]|nr:PEGA domain-containing protein [Verrucomicrobiota bacterium]
MAGNVGSSLTRRGMAAVAGCVGVLVLTLALGGCATVSPRPRGAAASPPPTVERPMAPDTVAAPGERAAPAVTTVPRVEAPPATTQPGVTVSPEVPLPDRPPEGWAWVWVETEPAGAMVVVDGVPVGRAPRRVDVEVTPQGFARQGTTIRVRFVAETVQQTSVTTELALTPRDRVPARIEFTRERVVRRQ